MSSCTDPDRQSSFASVSGTLWPAADSQDFVGYAETNVRGNVANELPSPHSRRVARTEGGYNLLVRTGKLRLRRLLVNRRRIAHAADCRMAGEDWLGAIRAGITIGKDIDVEVLRYLTDADLEKIGLSLGAGESCWLRLPNLAAAQRCR
jgi:hypothetical protein